MAETLDPAAKRRLEAEERMRVFRETGGVIAPPAAPAAPPPVVGPGRSVIDVVGEAISGLRARREGQEFAQAAANAPRPAVNPFQPVPAPAAAVPKMRQSVPAPAATAAPTMGQRMADFLGSIYASQEAANMAGAALPSGAPMMSDAMGAAVTPAMPAPVAPAASARPDASLPARTVGGDIAGYFSRNAPMEPEFLRRPVTRTAPPTTPDFSALANVPMVQLLDFLRVAPQPTEPKQPTIDDMIKAEAAAMAAANRDASIRAGTPPEQAFATYNENILRIIGRSSDPLAAVLQGMQMAQGEGT